MNIDGEIRACKGRIGYVKVPTYTTLFAKVGYRVWGGGNEGFMDTQVISRQTLISDRILPQLTQST